MPNAAPHDRVDELLRAEDALRRAQRASDVAALEHLLDDTLVFTGPDGRLYSKADDLAAHRSGAMQLSHLEASDEEVRRMGDVAVIVVRIEMAGSFHGAPFVGAYRYTRVWRKFEDGWRIVAGQVGAIVD